MEINRTPAPAPEEVNEQELQQLLRAMRLGYKPGACIRTMLAGIVATGALLGIDYSQERDYAEPRLLTECPLILTA